MSLKTNFVNMQKRIVNNDAPKFLINLFTPLRTRRPPPRTQNWITENGPQWS